MFDVEQETNRCDPSMQDDDGGVHPSVIVLVLACIAMVLLSIAVSGHAIWRILKTTPFMGIPVDALGNRIPIQGYPELWFGSMGVLVFTFLAGLVWWECERIRFNLRTLLVVMTLFSAVLGLGVFVVGR